MTTRWIDRLYSQALGEVGLRPMNYAFLSRLAADGPLMVSQLADRLAIERTTCTRELQPLTRSGLVTVEEGADRRQRVVHLTPAGEAKLAEGRPHWEAVQRRVADAFGSEPTGDLLVSLRELLAETQQLMAR
ncbi:MarR family winged helix-turn-helix transcriptional regulator [Streptomyces boluensis]|uniref:Helix-turn-helix domain-containing protein n=1 Tax=Streptomyces boluensis TaxID=1775135 RepID=A0A964UP99_9ACTN|nr:MarR family winged helix-turn-helix transcriptional regulator [Streptomyces boluensis]NBE52751.1 helix-turn-helix domain-containing protein [Streptomyces boluensis]